MDVKNKVDNQVRLRKITKLINNSYSNREYKLY